MNLPSTMADWLRSAGHDAVMCANSVSAMRPDREIFERAAANSRIAVTFDLDFGEIAGLARGAAVGAVLLRLRLPSRQHLQQRPRVAISTAARALEAGAIVVVEDSRIRIRPRPTPE